MSLYWAFEPIRVDFHLDSGYTKVILERLVGREMMDGDWDWDIPTASIPPNLRTIGSRFLLSWQQDDIYNPGNSLEIRAVYEKIRTAYADLPIVRLEHR
jgi:hypothetical protein